jgi:hypothetical protein
MKTYEAMDLELFAILKSESDTSESETLLPTCLNSRKRNLGGTQ